MEFASTLLFSTKNTSSILSNGNESGGLLSNNDGILSSGLLTCSDNFGPTDSFGGTDMFGTCDVSNMSGIYFVSSNSAETVGSVAFAGGAETAGSVAFSGGGFDSGSSGGFSSLS